MSLLLLLQSSGGGGGGPSPLLNDLVSYWPLDEASGNALDAHGSNDLTDQNTVGSAAGKINNARDFESGSTEYFSHTDNTDLSTGDVDFTITAWVKLESFDSFHGIVSKFLDADREFILEAENAVSGTFRWRVGGGLNTVTSTFGTLSTGVWYFVVAWHDSTNNEIGLSVNAGTPDTVAHGGGLPDTAADFEIGRQGDIGRYFDGVIDEVGFWKRVLTSQERTDLYNGGDGLAYPFGSAGEGVTVTPTTAALTTSTFAPTVALPVAVTPATAALTTAIFAPSVTVGVRATPTTANLTLTAFAPTVATPRTVTPTTVSLTLTGFAPSVNVGIRVTIGSTALALATFAPTVAAPRVATPGTAALITARFAPSVNVGVRVTPTTKALTLATFAPTVANPQRVTPATLSLTLTTFTPFVNEPVPSPDPTPPIAGGIGWYAPRSRRVVWDLPALVLAAKTGRFTVRPGKATMRVSRVTRAGLVRSWVMAAGSGRSRLSSGTACLLPSTPPIEREEMDELLECLEVLEVS